MKSISQKNPRWTLDVIFFERESLFLERKSAEVKPGKLANALIGMLNSNGGTVIVGVSDLGEPSGVGSLAPEKLDLLRKVVHDHIDPPARIDLEEVTLDSAALLFIYHVEQDCERLFKRKDSEEVYQRVADSTMGPLRREQVKALEYNRSIRSFEEEICEDFDPGDFDPVTCEEYRKKMNFSGNFEELLLKRGLAVRRNGTLLFRKAAVLLFARNPEINLPSALVRYVRYDGSEKRSGSDFNVIKDERLEGNILSLIRQLEIFLEGALRDYYFLNLDLGRFERIPEYPKAAWLEGIVNALCHRSYNFQGNPILISHFNDRLVISNSGPLPAQVTVANICTERYSRNPKLARALFELAYVRELNEGVPRIFSAMRQSMLAEPEYTNSDNMVTLTLRNQVASRRETIHAAVLKRIEDFWPSLNPSQRGLVNHLLIVFEADLENLANKLDLSEQAVRYNLNILSEAKIVIKMSEKKRDRHALYRFADE